MSNSAGLSWKGVDIKSVIHRDEVALVRMYSPEEAMMFRDALSEYCKANGCEFVNENGWSGNNGFSRFTPDGRCLIQIDEIYNGAYSLYWGDVEDYLDDSDDDDDDNEYIIIDFFEIYMCCDELNESENPLEFLWGEI